MADVYDFKTTRKVYFFPKKLKHNEIETGEKKEIPYTRSSPSQPAPNGLSNIS